MYQTVDLSTVSYYKWVHFFRNFNSRKSYELTENQVHGNQSVETIFFEKVYSGKGLDLLPSCYKATHEIIQTDSDFLRQFIIKFNESFATEDIPRMTIYFTSESNSYGITQKRWVDGRVFETDLEIERYCKIPWMQGSKMKARVSR